MRAPDHDLWSQPWQSYFSKIGIPFKMNVVAFACPCADFVCLFVWGLSSHSRIFHSHGDVTIAGEGLQILTYARHSWPLSSEGSLTCHTYCDTGLPFKMVISEDPWHSHLLPSVWRWSCHYLFLRLRSVATGDRTPISRMRGDLYATAAVSLYGWLYGWKKNC